MGADVAIIIPAYNSARTIARAVESALSQTVACDVIVIDDASGDETVEIVSRLATGNDRLHLIQQPHNQGPASARNAGIAHTESPWIALLDADDFMAADRIERLLATAAPGTWDLVADDIYKIDDGGDGVRSRLWSDRDFGTLAISFEQFVDANRSGARGSRRELGFLKPLMSRAFLDRHHLRYDSEMRLGEDYDLYARALACGARFCLVDPCGYTAVVRSSSLSGHHGARDLEAIVASDRRLLARTDLTAPQRSAVLRHLSATHKEWAWLRLIEAVKARDPLAAISCFAAPPAVIARLVYNLAEQVVLRTGRRLAAAFGGKRAGVAR